MLASYWQFFEQQGKSKQHHELSMFDMWCSQQSCKKALFNGTCKVEPDIGYGRRPATVHNRLLSVSFYSLSLLSFSKLPPYTHTQMLGFVLSKCSLKMLRKLFDCIRQILKSLFKAWIGVMFILLMFYMRQCWREIWIYWNLFEVETNAYYFFLL